MVLARPERKARRQGLLAAAIAAALCLVAVAGAAPSVSLTPDQRFVNELTSARAVSRNAIRRLQPASPAPDIVTQARADVTLARKHLAAATKLAPTTVGATGVADITTSLQIAAGQADQAAAALARASYGNARVKLAVANDAASSALTAFGVPLRKEFQAFTVYRDFSNIQGFEDFLGLIARVDAPISKVVIGIAGRETANFAEPGIKRGPPSLPITKLALYTKMEPSGAFTSGWGKLVNGVVVCDINPPMPAEDVFSIAFGPRVAKGTQFLVKFWSDDGRRSYAIMTTR